MTIFMVTVMIITGKEEEKIRNRRVAPLAIYAGTTVSPWLWGLLVASYGYFAVKNAGVIEESDEEWATCKSFSFNSIYGFIYTSYEWRKKTKDADVAGYLYNI